MQVCRSIPELRQWRSGSSGVVGFVPTMGALHAGHRSLLDRARSECDHSVCSIFVNPLQFGPLEDLARYPRPLDADLALCAEAGCDCVFLPAAEEMYAPAAATSVQVSGLDRQLEGAARPGHFTGVATVVAKLFNLVQPQLAYFGEKDYQQLCVIQRMVQDLDFPVAVLPCPTIREADGLAISSRNAYLSPAERAVAPRLFEALLAVRHTYLAGERDPARLTAPGVTLLSGARAARFELDYLAVRDARTLSEVEQAHDDCRVLLAARLGTTRLIDNIALVEAGATTPTDSGAKQGRAPALARGAKQ